MSTDLHEASYSRSDIVEKWLTWLKTDCGFGASTLMMDCSIAEVEIMKRAVPNISIYYDSFHVGKAWEQKMTLLHPVCSAKRSHQVSLRFRQFDQSSDQMISVFCLALGVRLGHDAPPTATDPICRVSRETSRSMEYV